MSRRDQFVKFHETRMFCNSNDLEYNTQRSMEELRQSSKTPRLIPSGLSKLASGQEWTPQLVATLVRALESADVVLVGDVIERLGDPADGGNSPEDQAACLQRIVGPQELHDAFRISAEWLELVRLADLSDVVEQNTVWTSELLDRLENWLVDNVTLAQSRALASALGHPESAAITQWDSGAADVVLDLAKVTDPQEVANAWRRLHPSVLTTSEAADLKTLYRALPRGGKTGRTRYRADRHASDAFINRLRTHRQRGVPVTKMGQAVGITPTQVYYLTRTPSVRGNSTRGKSSLSPPNVSGAP